MQKLSLRYRSAIWILVLVVAVFSSACTDSSKIDTVQPVHTTAIKTPATPAPEKEIVYVYITVTVTPATPTPVPAITKDSLAVAALPVYNRWRYQYISNEDGSSHYGDVITLLKHLERAPDAKSYELYYQNGRTWKEDLELLIDNVVDHAPSVRSVRMNRSIHDYTKNLTIQNGTIRTLDLVLTNWEFTRAGAVTNGIVVNITNATKKMDREISLIT